MIRSSEGGVCAPQLSLLKHVGKLIFICDNEPNLQFSTSGSLWCPVTVGPCAVAGSAEFAREKITEPADFSVASNVNFVNFLVDLSVLNRRGSVGSPVFAGPLTLAMFREDVSTIFSCSVLCGGAGSLREVPPHLFYGAHRTADLETESNVEPDGIMVENNF